jgi:hypothetical protein
MKTIFLLIATLLIGACSVSPTPEPSYTILETPKQAQNIEIRRYDPMIIAEVSVSGPRDKAINNGFRLLADYIFGKNVPAQKIGMTAPVLQSGETIGMTAPVLQQESGGDQNWRVQFVMPETYTMETLPKPIDAAITLKEIPATRAAVIRFSGFATNPILQEKTDELTRWVKAQGLTPAASPSMAFYNPPWTLPFLRRNEIILPLAP